MMEFFFFFDSVLDSLSLTLYHSPDRSDFILRLSLCEMHANPIVHAFRIKCFLKKMYANSAQVESLFDLTQFYAYQKIIYADARIEQRKEERDREGE